MADYEKRTSGHVAEPISSDSAPWAALEQKLAEALGSLEEDQYLIVSAKSGWWYVQFAAQGSFGLRAESVSNHYLPSNDSMSSEQLEAMAALGWNAPTGLPPEATPKNQPLGSPNFFRDFDQPVPFADVARLAVRTLREVFRIPHPGFLEYDAFERGGTKIVLAGFILKRRPLRQKPDTQKDQSPEQTRELLLKAARSGFADPELEFDKDGDLPLRFGSALVFARVNTTPHCISVFSPVVANITETSVVAARLNEFNATVRFARLFAVKDVVFAAVEVPAVPFVAEHFLNACSGLGGLVDELDDLLQAQLGGRTAFGEFRAKQTVH